MSKLKGQFLNEGRKYHLSQAILSRGQIVMGSQRRIPVVAYSFQFVALSVLVMSHFLNISPEDGTSCAGGDRVFSWVYSGARCLMHLGDQ